MDAEPGRGEHDSSWLLERLRQEGRATTARIVTLSVLEATDEHLSVNCIYDRMLVSSPGISKSTVYRALERLETLQLVHHVDVQGEARFGVANHSHHAVCTQCGRIVELDADVVSSLLVGLSGRTPVSLDRLSSLTVQGVCHNCSSALDTDEA